MLEMVIPRRIDYAALMTVDMLIGNCWRPCPSLKAAERLSYYGLSARQRPGSDALHAATLNCAIKPLRSGSRARP